MSRIMLFLFSFCVVTEIAAQSVIEEIVVTAQKREQSLQDVGIAVTAFSGEQLEAFGFENSTDIIAYSPGVSLAGDIGGQRAIYNIRGVVQNDYADHAEAPVAVYVDGTYLASTQAQTFGLYDVDRVEVLKGPQGTLFGRNATGGLVNTITAKPTEEFEAYFEVTGATFEQLRLEGAVSGALTDGARGRLSFLRNTQDEILENIYTGTDARGDTGTPGGGEDGYNDDSTALRAQLEFDIGNKGTFLISGNWADTTKSEGPYQSVGATQVRRADDETIDVIRAEDDPMNCDIIKAGACIDGNSDGKVTRPVAGGDFFGNAPDPDGSGPLVNKDFAFDDQNQIGSWGITGQLDYDLGWAEFVSVTDYKNFTRTVGLDSDQTPTAGLIFQSDGDTDQFSQELRLSGGDDRLNWIGGVYFLDIDIDFIQGLAETASMIADFGIAGREVNTVTNLKTRSSSIFGQIDYALTDALTLVGGVRIIREEKDFEAVISNYANTDDRVIETDANTITAELAQLDTENNETLWSGKIQLEYSPTDQSLYYFGVNRGVKAGSFNAPLFGGLSAYDPEVLWAYEAGMKKTLLNGLARVNASVYYYDYEDYQSFTFADNSSAVTNEQAEYIGAEIELFLTPTENLDIVIGGSYTDATIKDLKIAAGTFMDRTPPFTPEWQASGLFRYTWPMFSGSMSAQVSFTYQSSFFITPRNFTADRFDEYVVADARLTWNSANGLWDLVGYVDNLTDDDHSVIGFDVSGFYGTNQESYAKPRTTGLIIRRNF